ncbi:MAG: hypothetical protein Q4F28_10770 [Eubacteriales bacterium]|nr:hypothetical protein [Eubacteriales bacterium]
MMTKILKILTNHVWLCAGLAIVLIAAAATGWRWSLIAAQKSLAEDSIKALYQAGNQNTEASDQAGTTSRNNTYSDMTVKICSNQAYLCNQSGEAVFGPCKFIYDDLEYFSSSHVFRYVDQNGLIGFGKVEETGTVTVLYEGTFTEASRMAEGGSCVKEKDEYYYIDDEGKRFAGIYSQACPFAEGQGRYARIRKQDGSWAVINRKGEEILTGFDEIHELSYLTPMGVGVKGGKAVIFTLENDEDIQPGIICEFDGCTEISRPYSDADYVILKSKEGKQGAACVWNGEMVVPVVYEDMQWGYYDENLDDMEQQVWFQCRKEDGTYDIYYWSN